MSSKSNCNIQIIAIRELKMTVELPVEIEKPLYDEIYPFTKLSRFRHKFPGLAGKICIANFKQNKLSICDACFFATKRKTSKRNEQRQVYLKHSVVDQGGLLDDTIIENIHIAI